MTNPSRGDIWIADLDPVRGHEQAGKRPVVVLSVDRFNGNRSRGKTNMKIGRNMVIKEQWK